MRKILLAGVAAFALAGSTAVYAQHRWDSTPSERGGWDDSSRHHGPRMSAEDRLAFVDARIAAVKAGLKLTPDQEKMWPDVERAVRDFAKQRIESARASADQPQQQQENPIARLRERADRMATTATALKRIADAADPLYKSLDDGQKRRLALLTRMGGHHRFGFMREGGFGRGDDRGFGRGENRDRDHGHDGRGGGMMDRGGSEERL